MKYALFLDTMVYLHYRPVEQIDWRGALSILSGDTIMIVVQGVTLREIDNHKNHTPRLRERARRVSKRLAVWLSEGEAEIRSKVCVTGALASPDIDYAREELDRNVNDDVLVASALGYQRAHPDVTVVLITQDSYPQIRARGFGLTVHALPDDLKLPAEEDPIEKDNRALRRRLQQMQAALPVLALQFRDGAKSQRIMVNDPGPSTEQELAAALSTVERQYPPADALRPSSGGTSIR